MNCVLSNRILRKYRRSSVILWGTVVFAIYFTMNALTLSKYLFLCRVWFQGQVVSHDLGTSGTLVIFSWLQNFSENSSRSQEKWGRGWENGLVGNRLLQYTHPRVTSLSHFHWLGLVLFYVVATDPLCWRLCFMARHQLTAVASCYHTVPSLVFCWSQLAML